MIFDLGQEIRNSTNLNYLDSLLSTLIGQPFLKAEFCYDGELMVHFGLPPIAYMNHGLAAEYRGPFVVTTRASAWRFVVPSGESPVIIKSEGVNDTNQSEVIRLLASLVGQQVIDARAAWSPLPKRGDFGYSLIIRLANGTYFSIEPTDDAANDAMTDWELFTPFRMRIVSGPGPVFSYLNPKSESSGTGGEATGTFRISS